MKKVYELKGMDACRMQTTYLGVKVNLEFKNGNFINNKRARLMTDNPFVQDAIENDSRFGSFIILAEVLKEEPTVIPEVEEEEKPRPKRATKRLKSQAELNAESSVADKTAEEKSVKSINDAVTFFQARGEAVNSDEDIEVLKEKYNVTFPNLKQ